MFITFEGGEGSGKSTIAYELWRRLQRWKIEALLTREPGGTEVAERIRGICVDKTEEVIDVRTEVLLFAASRRQHLVQKIIPALEEGKVVISDRFVDSSIVYQGSNRWSGGFGKVIEINNYVTADALPDLTFLFDIDPEIALERIRRNNRETNRFDEEDIEYHERIRHSYLRLARENPERFVIIDASRTQEEVFEEVLKRYEEREGSRRK